MTLRAFRALILALGAAAALAGCGQSHSASLRSHPDQFYGPLYRECVRESQRPHTPAIQRACEQTAKRAASLEAALAQKLPHEPAPQPILGLLRIRAVPPGWSQVFQSTSLWTGSLGGRYVTVYIGVTRNPTNGAFMRSAVLVADGRTVRPYFAPTGRAVLALIRVRGAKLMLRAGSKLLTFDARSRQFGP